MRRRERERAKVWPRGLASPQRTQNTAFRDTESNQTLALRVRSGPETCPRFHCWEETELGRFLLPLARVVGSPRAGMKNLAFHGTETCKGSPLLREAGRMPALGCQLQVHCSAHLCLSSLQEVPNAWGLVNTRKVAVTSALRMGLPWAEQAPEMLASPCISLP